MGLIRSSSGDPIEQHDYHDLVSDLLSDSDVDDLLFTVSVGGDECSIEMVDFGYLRDDFRGFNVASLDGTGIDPSVLAVDVPLECDDHGDIYAVFESDATTRDEFIDELDQVLDGLGCSRDDVQTVRERELGSAADGLIAWIHEKITPSDG